MADDLMIIQILTDGDFHLTGKTGIIYIIDTARQKRRIIQGRESGCREDGNGTQIQAGTAFHIPEKKTGFPDSR